MSLQDRVIHAARDWIAATTGEDGSIRLVTQCLYPSNDAVRVRVIGGSNSFQVSDDGGAMEETSAAGYPTGAAHRTIARLVSRQGLNFKNGIIFSPTVSEQELPAAILLVANLSKEATHWCFDHLKLGASRNFRGLLRDLLDRHYNMEIQHNAPVVGRSNKQWHFDHLLHGPDKKRILIDPVVNDASSVNARLAAHLDVRSLGDPGTLQRIVYDDRQEWTSSDLTLLSMGAPVVPFSRARETVERLMAA